MPDIAVLSEEIVKKIAAGEVVERPSSAIKELIENSLDAGAGKINIEVEKAGKRLLRVHDDGSGMNEENLKLALLRHSTSKISRFEDIEKIRTFGFRGEALYSIFAVSKLKITSSTGKEPVSHFASGEGGKILKTEKRPPAGGTTVEVEDLFFNVPARAKFLKSDFTERSRIVKTVEEAALANPETLFSLKMDGKEIYLFPRGKKGFFDNLGERVFLIYGKTLSENLVRIDKTGDGMRLRGLVSPANGLCSGGANQSFFANRRPVSSKTARQAIYKAYEPFRGGKHLLAVLFLDINPELCDVNVHPQKKEVKFADENKVFRFIRSSISCEIEKNRQPTQVFLEKTDREEAPFSREMEVVFPSAPAGPGETAETASLFEPGGGGEDAGRGRAISSWYSPPAGYLGQIAASYLVFDSGGGLLIVDQHAAQERILFEKYLDEFEKSEVHVQPLLAPISVEISRSRIETAMRWREWLKKAGFEIELFGTNVLKVSSTPAVFNFSPDSLAAFVSYLSEILGDPEKSTEEFKIKTVATLACRKAVKAGERLKEKEALHLLKNLSEAKDGLRCPHGRSTLIFLSGRELAGKFHRTNPAG